MKVKRENGREEDFSEIYIDLLVEEDDENIVITDITDKEEGTFIRITELLDGGLLLYNKYEEMHHENIERYRNRITTYDFPAILIKNSSIDIATEIFTRINIGGKKLSIFEIMVAKTFDVERNFDLSEKYDELIERLSQVDYETIPDSTVLQTVSICLVKECSKKDILKLDKQNFIDIWDSTVDAIERAVDYFRGYYRIPVSRLLPYNALIVPFAYFFYNHKDKPIGNQQKYLEDYFWRSALTERFSSGQETKLAQDIKRIDLILNNIQPTYEQRVDIRPEAIMQNGWFSAGRSYIKGLLCILAFQRPLSFNDNSVVHINNNWLKQANSKNYHHFFPRAYLKKKGEDEFRINHILNITIVDDFLNKRQIKANPPFQYMDRFNKINPDLEDTMKTHLIENLDNFGIWDNDYDKFLNARSVTFSNELRKRLIIDDNDNLNIVESEDVKNTEKNINENVTSKIKEQVENVSLEREFFNDMKDIYIRAEKECN